MLAKAWEQVDRISQRAFFLGTAAGADAGRMAAEVQRLVLGGLGVAILTIFKPNLARFTAPVYAHHVLNHGFARGMNGTCSHARPVRLAAPCSRATPTP